LAINPAQSIIYGRDRAYCYKPRFVDIRIKPPKDADVASARDRTCEHLRCRSRATARSPKSPNTPGEFYWFCQSHASEYNKQWNFFEGMGENAARAYREADAYGHRPTWNFTSGSGARRTAERAAKNFSDNFTDPFSLFGDRPAPEDSQTRTDDPPANMGRLQKRALETLRLNSDAGKLDVRKRYAELVRTYHPDSNGGDRSMEELMTRVVEAYQILKNAGRG